MNRCTSRTSNVTESQFARVHSMTTYARNTICAVSLRMTVPNWVVVQLQLGVTNTNSPFPSTV